MSVRIVVGAVVNESVATQIINPNDTLVINNVSYPVLSVTPLTGGQVEVVCDGDVQPAANAKIYIKEASGHIPLGTDSIPGLVTKRLRSYMETPNIAVTPNGVTTWSIMDEDGVPASGLFEVGDWVKINGIEYLIQTVTAVSGGITVVTAPPAPSGAGQYTVYHFIEAGIIPLATPISPGLVAHTYNHAVGRQIDLYLPSVSLTTTALKDNAQDAMKWLCEPMTVDEVYAINYLSDSGATPASYRVRNVTKEGYITTDSSPNSTTWTQAGVITGSVIDTGDELEIEITNAGNNLDTEGIRISIHGNINNEVGGA